MGVYIKNIEMPIGGRILIVFPSGKVLEVSADATQNIFRETQAVPVPQHGRLGDLDELARKIEHERFHHTHTDGLTARHHVAEYGHFLKAISDAPTIIPASEKET